MKLTGVPYLADYDDALFHQYDQHRSGLVRWFLGKKIATVMRLADVVIAGNAYLAQYADKAGAKRAEIIPTVIDLDKFGAIAAKETSDGPQVIGWIGSPTTAHYLVTISDALAKVCKDRNVRLRLIGAGSFSLPDLDIESLSWNEESEIEQLKKFDIGIMPLPDSPWERGKCGFKLIQYMACGLPVVASPVGVNSEIVEPAVNGFLANSHKQWIEALDKLLSDPELRHRMGAAGRLKVEQEYSIQVTGPRFAEILLSAAGRN